jgi:hypothetical protein
MFLYILIIQSGCKEVVGERNIVEMLLLSQLRK